MRGRDHTCEPPSEHDAAPAFPQTHGARRRPWRRRSCNPALCTPCSAQCLLADTYKELGRALDYVYKQIGLLERKFVAAERDKQKAAAAQAKKCTPRLLHAATSRAPR